MHGKVRDHIYISLEETKIHAGRVVIERLAEIAALNQVTHLLDWTSVDEGVIDVQHEAALVGFLYQLAGLHRGLCHRLFQPDVLASLQGRHGE